ERVALGVGLEAEEAVELRSEEDRLDVGDEVLVLAVELCDPGRALAPGKLADALDLLGVALLVFRRRRSGRLGENVGSEGKRQGSGERFHRFPESMRIYLDNNATTA